MFYASLARVKAWPHTPRALVAGAALVVAGLTFTLSSSQNLLAQTAAESGLSRAMPVRTATVKLENGYFARRTFTGRALPGQTSQLSFELAGTLVHVGADIGSVVSKGDTLAALDTSRLEAQKHQIEAEHAEAEANLNLAERTLARTKDTFAKGHTSAQRLDEAEAQAIALTARVARLSASLESLNVDLAKARLTAPYDGVITARNLDEGSVVAPGQALFEISETGTMEAHVGLPPEYARAVEDGAPFTLLDNRRKPIEGAVLKSFVPVITGQTRTMMLTFDLKAGSAARGELITAVVNDWQEDTGTWLPLRALSADVRGLWRVYKVHDGANGLQVGFENVQILYTDGNRVFVTGTLTDGDRVISEGLHRLAPGQRVEILTDSTVG